MLHIAFLSANHITNVYTTCNCKYLQSDICKSHNILHVFFNDGADCSNLENETVSINLINIRHTIFKSISLHVSQCNDVRCVRVFF